jgi:3-hydroxy-9,10-secoandrosta-1,3,5(10)-triene-9,17-dione monooxygenase
MTSSTTRIHGTDSGKLTEVGLDGVGSIALSTEKNPGKREEADHFLDTVRSLRPQLRADQADTEQRGTYSQEIHERFLEAGLYKLLQPKAFGGYEVSVASFYAVVSEIARGCPSTAWCFCLGSAHSLQLGSYWPIEVQEEIFDDKGYFIAPLSSSPRGVAVEPTQGGYYIGGKWRYSSGAPYSTHFIGTINIPAADGGTTEAWFIVPRDEYDVLDDWGGIIGMRGSGSNSVSMDRVFVPERFVVETTFKDSLSGATPGSASHGNSLYAGPFNAFAVGEVSAVAVGLGYAVLDEYERIIRTSKAPDRTDGTLRVQHADWRRTLGVAMANVDAAAAISTHNGELYGMYAERSVTGVESFSAERSLRLRNANVVLQRMIFDSTYSLLRTAGSSTLIDGQRMQRYFRDITTTTTRTSQLEFNAAEAVEARLSGAARCT